MPGIVDGGGVMGAGTGYCQSEEADIGTHYSRGAICGL